VGWRDKYPGSVKLKLDLHEIYNQSDQIDKALNRVFDEALAKKAPMIEIIPGKGSGQLKKHVIRFLEDKRLAAKRQGQAINYRVEKDSKNFGRLFVHFRW
jgi:dsDNA-specific endonuclease/ATPase MutS2